MEPKPAAGSLGPRLAGRLTAELILRSPQHMNCINQYEISMRGHKIGAIENLGATENQFDCIDLSDNAIVKLDGFSRLPRLKTLLLSNNRIARIAKNLEEPIPNLETLILSANRLENLRDVDPLVTLPKLRMLSLSDNPVTKQPQYRLYVISKLPKLKVLDFRKVKQKERDQAAALFGGASAATGQEEVAEDGSKTFEPDEDFEAVQASMQTSTVEETAAAKPGRQAPTAEQLTAIQAAIANAQTLEEVRRLEEALVTGHLPSEFQFGTEPQAQPPPHTNGDQPVSMDEG